MNEYEGFKRGDRVVIRDDLGSGTIVGFKKMVDNNFTHYIVVITPNGTNNWYPTSLTKEKRMENEFYILVAEHYSSVFTTKEQAEAEIVCLLETYDADQIYVYKGVEVEFSHGVVIKEK